MKKNIVVIGGGFAGSHAAKSLERNFEVTLIDTKEYFEFTPGVLRTVVEPAHVKKIQVLHTHYLKSAQFVLGTVSEVSAKHVVVNKKKIAYDYLIVSSGSSYEAPFKESGAVIATRAEHLRACSEDLRHAKTVAIVGGGLVGVELAGEIVWKYGREKEVILLQAADTLIARNSPKAIAYATKWLEKRGVKIMYGQKLVGKKGADWITEKGEKLQADLAFMCTGIRPNYGFMKKHFKNSIDEKGFLKVNENLQLNGYSNIFAIGDVSDRKEEKTAQNAERQADIVIDNILRLERGKELQKYVSKKTPMVISLGKHCAIYENDTFVMTGFIPAYMKHKIEWWEMLKKRR